MHQIQNILFSRRWSTFKRNMMLFTCQAIYTRLQWYTFDPEEQILIGQVIDTHLTHVPKSFVLYLEAIIILHCIHQAFAYFGLHQIECIVLFFSRAIIIVLFVSFHWPCANLKVYPSSSSFPMESKLSLTLGICLTSLSVKQLPLLVSNRIRSIPTIGDDQSLPIFTIPKSSDV